MEGESNDDRKNWLAGELGAKEDSSLCNKHLPPKKLVFCMHHYIALLKPI